MESTKSFKMAENQFRSMSVFSYFTSELTRGYLLEREEEKYAQKRQRVYTFMKTPRELEKFSTYGFFQCLDAFLFIFTFLPLRILLAVLKIFTVPCGFMRSRKFLEPAQICDILKGIILVVCSFIMTHIDTSMMYHLVRGQATIKLYVFFNMLDMADRLLSNFGHDILDALFWTATEPRGKKREHIGTLPHLLIAIIYVIIHCMLILFQATVLNVAFNSHNKSLLVIMMSNNFVEIKSNLFKKVDASHLYQIACSDVKERFHYVILLSVVCVRNMNEVSWDIEHLWVLLPDALMVLVSEILVDWGKHAFILKFNEIPADVYREFKVKLALDMATSRQSQAFTDHSDLVSRRMGLTPLPLACLLYRILTKSIPVSTYMHYSILFVLYLCLMSFKVLNSIILLGHSYTVIENYDKENQSASSPNEEQEQPEPANQKSSPAADSAPSVVNHKTHERTASFDEKLSGNFSQILAADSYTELTQVRTDTAIEQTRGFKVKSAKLADSESEDEIQSIPNDSESGSHDNILTSPDVSHAQYILTGSQPNFTQNASGDTQSSNESLANSPYDQIKSSQNSLEESGPGGDTPKQFHGHSVFQRSHRGIFMNFGVGKRSGSSISLPETVGIQECSEQEECSPVEETVHVFPDKTEKVE
ncbi:transmembrane anterior posterior transformation protein 1 homolog [Mercenaria mercenaria]|uniref:transmembrane anterior posterior transformation protein 1 homolog n=1 Tax=Mercenaria mercenaria TaxID=6596 RepID=UPI00234F5A4D|nr:transmembrane anterior posterior transformation protein 1 homolog [Mercenaria mercenaria]